MKKKSYLDAYLKKYLFLAVYTAKQATINKGNQKLNFWLTYNYEIWQLASTGSTNLE